MQHPVAQNLQRHVADQRRIRARAAVVNLGERQQTLGLLAVLRLPCELSKSCAVEIIM